jgi:sugar phosphate isomerase/epimerase
MIARRQFLAASLVSRLAQAAPGIRWDRLSILTDEAARTAADAIAFARQYNIKWVELRGVPGGGGTYAFLPEERVRETARELKEAGLKVSFLNTPMLKFQMPGTEYFRPRNETEEQKAKRAARDQQANERRMEDLGKAIRAAEIFGVRKIRVFTYNRVADVEGILPKVAAVLDELGAVAHKAGMELLIENEASQNVATSPELKRILELVKSPGIGINWDPVNEIHREGNPWPEGYNVLPKSKIGNVQLKAEALILGKVILPWGDILAKLDSDGYKGNIGLETHVFDGTLLEKSHLCVAKLKELMPA